MSQPVGRGVEPCAVCGVGVLRVPGEHRVTPDGLVHETCFRASPARAAWTRAERERVGGVQTDEREGVTMVSAGGERYLFSADDWMRVPTPAKVKAKDGAWIVHHAITPWDVPGAVPGPLAVLYAALRIVGRIANPGAVARGRIEEVGDALRLKVDEVLPTALLLPYAMDLKLPFRPAPRPADRPVRFSATGDATRPFAASVDGGRWAVRIGDFPEEALYHLEIDGKDVFETDDWPARWEKP